MTYHIHLEQLLLHQCLPHFLLTFYIILYALIEHWELLENDDLQKEAQS